MAGRIQSVLYDIDQTQDTTSEDRAMARKNIGAYEDKTAAGGGTGIPKSDLASDVQSSLVKADSSVQSVTSNGQTLTKSAAGAIDIPKATNTVWGVVQVVNELLNDQNVIPNSRVIKEAVDGLKARATFWTVQEWQTQSAQPGDPSKIYYVGPKGTGNDKYDMYEWSTKSNIYILTDESTISLDGYWHGAPDILGEDTVAPFVTSIEKNADDTVKYRTCSATVGNRALPVFMDSGVVTPADPHFMYPTVNKSTTFEEVEALVNAGYRPIFVPEINSYGVHTRYILTGARAEGCTPAFIFTALIPGSKYTSYFTSERMQTVICQHPNNETEETWVENDEILIPNIPEPNQMGEDVGKILTVGDNGELAWLPINRTLKIRKTASTAANELYAAVNNAYNAGYIPVIEDNLGQGSFDYYYLVRKTTSNFEFENSTTTYTGTPRGIITRLTISANALNTSTVNLQRALSTSVTGFTVDYSKNDTPYYQSSSSTTHNDLSIELTIPAGTVAHVIAKSLVKFTRDSSLKTYKAALHVGALNDDCMSVGYANFDAYQTAGTGTSVSLECSKIIDNRSNDTAMSVFLNTSVDGSDTSTDNKARRNMVGVVYCYNILTIAGL